MNTLRILPLALNSLIALLLLWPVSAAPQCPGEPPCSFSYQATSGSAFADGGGNSFAGTGPGLTFSGSITNISQAAFEFAGVITPEHTIQLLQGGDTSEPNLSLTVNGLIPEVGFGVPPDGAADATFFHGGKVTQTGPDTFISPFEFEAGLTTCTDVSVPGCFVNAYVSGHGIVTYTTVPAPDTILPGGFEVTQEVFKFVREPSTVLLLLTGLAGIALLARRRRPEHETWV